MRDHSEHDLLRGVQKVYRQGDADVRVPQSDVSSTSHPGQFVAVVGPSGSGKSTLLHLMGGLISRPPATSSSTAPRSHA